METPQSEHPRPDERTGDGAADRRAVEPASPPSVPGDQLGRAPREPGRSGPTQQVSWVYRQGDEVWVYRWRGSAAADGAAEEVARLRAAIEAAPPPGAEPDRRDAPGAIAGSRWTWLLIGVLTGLVLGVLLTYLFALPSAGGAEPTSLVGVAGAIVGMVGFGVPRVPRPAFTRRVSGAFLAGLTIYMVGWVAVGDPALSTLHGPIVVLLAPLTQLAGLLCIVMGVKWLYDALGTTIVAEVAPFMTVFSGTVAAAIAILLFLRGTGQALAGSDLDSLTFTIAALVASTASLILIVALLLGRQAQWLTRPTIWSLLALLFVTVVQFLADFGASVTIALYGATQNTADLPTIVANDPRVLALVVVYVLVVYAWGLAVLLTLLGGSLVRPRATPSPAGDVRLGDLTLRWRSE